MRGAGETLRIQGSGVWSLLITLDTFGRDFYVWGRNSEDGVKRARPPFYCQVLLGLEYKPSLGRGPFLGISVQFPSG